MIKKILVAYDNGSKAKRAVEIAKDLANNSNGEVCLVYSPVLPDYLTHVVGGSMVKHIKEQSHVFFKKVLDEIEDKLKQEGIKVTSVILDEVPGKAIVNYAEKENYDLIIMGSSNRLEKIIEGFGSVSNYVLQHSRCPVMIIKDHTRVP
ncbi:MAG TPA: hypothetical protein DCW46_06940 [Desulfotomaculum sp.]|nr:hypothetical protein [Desulfotomaculum sp.]